MAKKKKVDTSKFKRIELAPQSPEEVRKVQAKGEARARAMREVSEADRLLGQSDRESKSARRKARADAAADIATSAKERTAKRVSRQFGGNVTPEQVRPSAPAKDASSSDYRNLTDREHRLLATAQTRFAGAVTPSAREDARRTIGRSLQKGIPHIETLSSLLQASGHKPELACQGPGCTRSIPLTTGGVEKSSSDGVTKTTKHTPRDRTSDVVCEDCQKRDGGDIAGATYTDKPNTAVSTSERLGEGRKSSFSAGRGATR